MKIALLLQELSASLTDSQRYFAAAADRMDDPQLKEKLMGLGNKRAPLIEELANELARSHEDVPMDGTLRADLENAWDRIADLFKRKSVREILEHREMKEKELLEHYDRSIIEGQRPEHVCDMLQRHRALLSAGVEELIILKNRYRDEYRREQFAQDPFRR